MTEPTMDVAVGKLMEVLSHFKDPQSPGALAVGEAIEKVKTAKG